MSNQPTPPDGELPIEEEIRKMDRHSHLGAEATAAASGVAAGALLGVVAGPPGVLAGAIVGGVIGAVTGIILDEQEQQRDAEHIEQDRISAEEDDTIHRNSRLPPPPRDLG
ncbi:MAG: glycine zipper domain-containing protein [Polyangiaceae bacterium]|jgi:phage tail tape-measure protein|nr:glycine zipper domain-containing protein [Polyangiaceae bacterium]